MDIGFLDRWFLSNKRLAKKSQRDLTKKASNLRKDEDMLIAEAEAVHQEMLRYVAERESQQLAPDRSRIVSYAHRIADLRRSAQVKFELANQVESAKLAIGSIEAQSLLSDASDIFTTLVSRSTKTPEKTESDLFNFEKARDNLDAAHETMIGVFPSDSSAEAAVIVDEVMDSAGLRIGLPDIPIWEKRIMELPIPPVAKFRT